MEEKISAVKDLFENADENTVRELIKEYGASEKAGIIKLVEKYTKQLDKLEAERMRVENMLVFEKENSIYANICGIDEAGRGPLAVIRLAGIVNTRETNQEELLRLSAKYL